MVSNSVPMTSKISKYEHLIYLSVWIIVFIVSLLLIGGDVLNGEHDKLRNVWVLFRDTIPFLITFIIHAYILIPFILERQKYITYALLLLIVLALFSTHSYVNYFNDRKIIDHHRREYIVRPDENHEPVLTPIPPRHRPNDPNMPKRPEKVPAPVIFDLSRLILLISANLLVRYTFTRNARKKRIEELQQEITKAELNNLKSQVSPHFLMNVLNNIHGLIEIDQSRAQNMLLELSNMMRYVLYDCDSQYTTLSKEIDFIENYIKLMSARYPADKLTINLEIVCSQELRNQKIPPLIFIVFIENTFKHGVSYSLEEPGFIYIMMEIINNRLHFVCRNRVHEITSHNHKPGIGLKNISRRLDVIYGENYQLILNNDSTIYCVDLEIPLEYEN